MQLYWFLVFIHFRATNKVDSNIGPPQDTCRNVSSFPTQKCTLEVSGGIFGFTVTRDQRSKMLCSVQDTNNQNFPITDGVPSFRNTLRTVPR